jgi:hypothetical protein
MMTSVAYMQLEAAAAAAAAALALALYGACSQEHLPVSLACGSSKPCRDVLSSSTNQLHQR